MSNFEDASKSFDDAEELEDDSKQTALDLDPRVKIEYDPTNMDLMAAKVIEVMKKEGGFYNRDGIVIVGETSIRVKRCVERDTTGRCIEKRFEMIDVPGIKTFDDPVVMVHWMSSRIVFTKIDNRKAGPDKRVRIRTPQDVAITVIKVGAKEFPPIRGVMNTPTLRLDRTVLWKTGYDEITGYYMNNTAFNQMSLNADGTPWISTAKISREMALKAMSVLRGLFREVAFADEKGLPIPTDFVTGLPIVRSVSESVALSGFLSLILRPILSAVPAHLVNAAQSGDGKTFSQQLIGCVVLGDEPEVLNWEPKGNGEENAKMLKAVMKTGTVMVIFDNVNGEFKGMLLAQAITQPRLNFREFSVLEMANPVENGSCIFANGINIRPHSDLNRRFLMCKLNRGMINPETKQYKLPDALNIAIEKRGIYIECALAIVLAYMQAGSPRVLEVEDGKQLVLDDTTLAGFDDWMRYVRAPLMWAGCADPLGSRAEIKWQSTDNIDRTAVIASMKESNNGAARTASEWINDAHELSAGGNKTLLDAFMTACVGKLTSKDLGDYFRDNQNSPDQDGNCIVAVKKDRNKIQVWAIQSMFTPMV